MTFPVWVELVCARCSISLVGRFVSNGQIPKRELKKEAKLSKFVFEHKEVFCSDYCCKKYEEDM